MAQGPMHEALNAMTTTVTDIRFQKLMMSVAKMRMRRCGRSTDSPKSAMEPHDPSQSPAPAAITSSLQG
jgi:hypothetical protein